MRQKLHYRLVVLNRVVTRLIALTPIPRWVVSLKRPEIRGPFSTELTSNNNWLSILLTRTGSQEEFVSVVFGCLSTNGCVQQMMNTKPNSIRR